jgi:hypothetical protein
MPIEFVTLYVLYEYLHLRKYRYLPISDNKYFGLLAGLHFYCCALYKTDKTTFKVVSHLFH